MSGVAVGDRAILAHFVSWIDGPFEMRHFGADLGTTLDGWMAEYVKVPAAALVKVPDSLSDEAAAPLAAATLTAWHAVVEVGQVRAGDLVSRHGGEEFVVAMPGTDLATAERIAERIRMHVAGSPFRVSGGSELLTVTISIGVAVSDGSDDTPAKLLKRADEALYEAKASGRNKVIARAA